MPVNIHFNRNPGGYELANNLETEIAGVAALDAAQGKKIKELIENCVPAFYVGSVITNKINPQNAMIVNSLTLQPGTYVITASVEFSSGFLADVSSSILVNDYQYCTNRGTGAGGGGMTPTTILELTTQSEIKLSVYQASSSEVELSKNQLQAIKLS